MSRIDGEHGMVMLTVLLFLFVITILVLAMMNTSLLETKMSGNYLETMRSFYLAENQLMQKEQDFLAGKSVDGVKMIQQVCGVDFYRVSVDKLQSIVVKVGEIGKCNPKPTIHNGRQSLTVGASLFGY